MKNANNLRLRLVVRRHGLPEVRVVFAVQLDNDPTIANLLEQVNEIIPLESESNNWGLEDYTVELRDSDGHAFDCLHFQQVSAVLKNDEQVFIRPLDTVDRRKRKLSGRHQTSGDGKHLFDGVAFGRPRLKAPRDRPPVDIPPLKRRRITYGDEERDEEAPQLLLTEHGEEDRGRRRRVRIRARFDDTDEDRLREEEEEEDDDFTAEDDAGSLDEDDEDEDSSGANEGPDSNLEDELRDLQADLDQAQEGQLPIASRPEDKPPQSFQQELARGLDLEALDKITTLRAAFPDAPVDVCERTLTQRKGDLRSAYQRLRLRHEPTMSVDDVVSAYESSTRPGPVAEDGSSVVDMVRHYDQHGFPSGSILAGTAAASMVEAMRRSGHPVQAPVHTRFDDHAEPRNHQAPAPAPKADSESESDEDSDSGPEVASSKLPHASAGARHSDDDEQTSASSDSDSESEDDSSSDSESVGSSESSDTSNSDGDSESDADFSDESSDEESQDEVRSTVDSSSSDSESDDTETSSEEESSAGSSAGAAKSESAHKMVTNASTPKPQSTTTHQPAPQKGSDVGLVSASESMDGKKPVRPGHGKTKTQRRNARRRAALRARKAAARGEVPPESAAGSPVVPGVEPTTDLSESIAAKKAALLQNLSFLGVPSKETGEIGKDSPPKPNATQRQPHSPPAQPQQSQAKPAAEEDPEAWRKKIIYRGVECCYDGVELSEPPFPFVQRWDPQQQYFSRDKRGGRSKRKQRNQMEYQDEESRASIKRRKYDGAFTGHDAGDDGGSSYLAQKDGTGGEDTILNYDDEPQEQPPETKESPGQRMDEEDLPPLPNDLTSLPLLQAGEAKVGMVLTWKQWLLSKATNWQPQVSNLTGVVVEVLEDNSVKVQLAKRDRNLDQNEKVYDEDGNRVYDKFELPGMDEEADEEAEQGYRTLDFSEMIEPRILQPATPTVRNSISTQQQPAVEGDGAAHDRASATLDREQGGDDGAAPQTTDVHTQPGKESIVSPVSVNGDAAGDISMSEDRRHEIS
ncbi:hypothetical protein VTK26DRAFT_4471 [Humicola hyalothermophila]